MFTPNGDLRKLSEGATVLDFAFDIHTNLGATCVGGKVNHRNVSFREVLRNGDIVEILTSKTQKPKADWLNIVTTSKARNKIRAYMREEQAKAASLGREELERKIKNWKLSITMDDAVMVLSKYYKLRTGTELYGQIAQQKIILPDIKEILTRHLNGTLDDGHPLKAPSAAKIVSDNDDALIIDNSLSNIEYKLAKCCNPIFGGRNIRFHDDQQRDHDPPAGLPERPAAEGTLPLPGVAGALAAERGEGRVRRDSAYPGRRCDRPGE